MFQACILQGALQQAAAGGAPAAAAAQFSMQTFGNQPATASAAGLNLPLQPSGPSQALGLGPPAAPPSSKVSQFNNASQQQGSPQSTPVSISVCSY